MWADLILLISNNNILLDAQRVGLYFLFGNPRRGPWRQMEFIIPATKDLQPGLEKVQEFLHQVHFSFLSLYTIAKIKKKIFSRVNFDLFGNSVWICQSLLFYPGDEPSKSFIPINKQSFVRNIWRSFIIDSISRTWSSPTTPASPSDSAWIPSLEPTRWLKELSPISTVILPF
jgi:hypothetical protein